MSFNKNERNKMQIITADAFQRTDALKNKLVKQAMALHRGQSYLRNSSLNIKLQRFDYGSRIQQIKSEIEKMFEPILRERVTVDGKGKLVKITPGVHDITLKDIDPSAQGFSDLAGTQGVQPGCIYFRYGFKRTILPDENTEAGQEAKEMFGELQSILSTVDSGFDINQFVNDLDASSVVPLPPFNTAHVRSESSERYVNELLSRMKPTDPGYSYLQQLVRRNIEYHDIFGPTAAAMPSTSAQIDRKSVV